MSSSVPSTIPHTQQAALYWIASSLDTSFEECKHQTGEQSLSYYSLYAVVLTDAEYENSVWCR